MVMENIIMPICKSYAYDIITDTCAVGNYTRVGASPETVRANALFYEQFFVNKSNSNKNQFLPGLRPHFYQCNVVTVVVVSVSVNGAKSPMII